MKLEGNSKSAVKLMRDLFTEAENQGVLQEVWRLVTALRGPDDGDDEKKHKYTTPLRAELLTRHQAYFVSIANEQLFPVTQPADETSYEGCGVKGYWSDLTHFEVHVRSASNILMNKNPFARD